MTLEGQKKKSYVRRFSCGGKIPNLEKNSGRKYIHQNVNYRYPWMVRF